MLNTERGRNITMIFFFFYASFTKIKTDAFMRLLYAFADETHSGLLKVAKNIKNKALKIYTEYFRNLIILIINFCILCSKLYFSQHEIYRMFK